MRKSRRKRQIDPAERDLVLKRGREDPVWWARNVLGVDPWPVQQQILEAVRDHPEVAVKSCHGAGKSWIAAVVVLWFLYNHKPSIVITTAPTDRQVRGILWKEIGKLQTQSKWPLGGKLLQQELKLSRDWWAIGFTAADYDPDRFQGYHEVNVLVVIDEAAGVSKQIYEAVDGVLSSTNSHRLEIGNPTDIMSEFGNSFKNQGPHKISISAFDTPNLSTFGITQEDIEQGMWEEKITGELPFPSLTTPQWVARQFNKRSKDSPFYQARVLAQFPKAGKDALIPLSWIESAQQRELEIASPHELGVDVGRGGDPNVIGERRGPVFRIIGRMHSGDTMETTGWVVQTLRETGATSAKVDVIGIGAGVVDRGAELGEPFIAANAGAGSTDKERYLNARAEWFWGLRERFQEGDVDIDPDDEDLAEQLASMKWKPDSRGRVVIEPKEEMKKRLGRSPDDADAMAIAYANIEESGFYVA